MATEINATYASEFYENLVAGTAVPSGPRYLALATTAWAEAAGGSYARQDISAAFPAGTAGDGVNDVGVMFTGLSAATYTQWMIFDHLTVGVYTIRGTFVSPQVIPGGGSLIVAVGDLSIRVDAI